MNHKEEQEYLNKLGERIRQLRKERGLTQSGCGVDDRTIRRIESNTEDFNPSYLTLAEIAKNLKISMKKLFDYDEFNENAKRKEKDEEYKELIDEESYLVTSDDSSTIIAIKKIINELIGLCGSENVYIGKTCNPYGRMTGDYNKYSKEINESTKPSEDYDIHPPHNQPHCDNGYGKMIILFNTDKLKQINALEKTLIACFKGRTNNLGKGGEGNPGSPPWDLYVVIKQEVLSKISSK